MSGSHRLLAADMWVGLSFAPTQERYNAFLARARPAFTNLLEGIVLQDSLTIPTSDYLTLTSIVDVLGDRAAISLMESGVLQFLRVKGALAYVGNGGGVVDISFPFKGDGTDASAIGADMPDAVRWALAGLTKKPDTKVTELAIRHSSEIELPKLREQIARATYTDFKQFPFNRAKDPARLPGVTSKTVRILGGQEAMSVTDDIGAVLALASANLELHLMSVADVRDSATSTPIGHLLKAHEIRSGHATTAFATLLELAGVPDIAESVLQKQLDLQALVDLRKTGAAEQFRTWFHENCAGEPTTTAKAYIELLSHVPKLQTKTAKILRFLITTGLGLIPVVGTVLGTAASAVDSFAVDGISQRSSPKFFIEQLKQLEQHARGRDA